MAVRVSGKFTIFSGRKEVFKIASIALMFVLSACVMDSGKVQKEARRDPVDSRQQLQQFEAGYVKPGYLHVFLDGGHAIFEKSRWAVRAEPFFIHNCEMKKIRVELVNKSRTIVDEVWVGYIGPVLYWNIAQSDQTGDFYKTCNNREMMAGTPALLYTKGFNHVKVLHISWYELHGNLRLNRGKR